jgi:hypothetical protein
VRIELLGRDQQLSMRLRGPELLGLYLQQRRVGVPRVSVTVALNRPHEHGGATHVVSWPKARGLLPFAPAGEPRWEVATECRLGLAPFDAVVWFDVAAALESRGFRCCEKAARAGESPCTAERA